MPIDTQAVFTAEALLNIARGSLGGFCIPDSTDSKPRKDNIFRFTFHGQHPETEQKPGHQLSQEDLSMPLKDLVGKILWIKVEGYVRHSFDMPCVHSFMGALCLPRI